MQILEILICTIDDGINNVINTILPPIGYIRYLISWQRNNDQDIPVPEQLTSRSDIRIVTLHGKGLSANRNHAIAHAKGDILLLADDDARYRPEYFKTILHAYEENPGADILTFQMVDEMGNPIKPYPTYPYNYAQCPKGCYYSSLEITMLRSDRLPKFDTRFGLGAAYLGCGEEEVFIHAAAQNKLSIRYIPKVIVETERSTTGSRFSTDVKVRRAKGAVLYVLHGYWGAVLRSLKYALHLKKNALLSFKDMYDGIKYMKNGTK